MRCADVENLVHPYVDGELQADDNALLERHAGECQHCKQVVSFHAGFKADVRARLKGARAPADAPEAPDRLRLSVLAALDKADARGEGPVPRPWRRFAPAAAAVFAAAAGITFFLAPSLHLASPAESPIVAEAIRAHEKNLPVEVDSPDAEVVGSWMRGKVEVPVRPPHLVALDSRTPASLVGGRVYHLRSRDVGQLTYRVGGSQVTVYVFDPSGLDLTARTVRRVGAHEVYITEERGYSVVLYRDRGVGYAFTSDLRENELLRLVEASLGDGAR